ncbi:UNVERIFIED_CONTAM: hypothetical protein FKN15_004959 [Acipenser sinensis]
MLLINKEEQLATEHVWAGRDSATVLFDYKNGIIAYRVFDGRACYAAKMNRNTFPALDKLRETLDNEKAIIVAWPGPVAGEMFFIDAGSCLRVDLLILGVSLCGHVDMGSDMGPDIAPLPLI